MKDTKNIFIAILVLLLLILGGLVWHFKGQAEKAESDKILAIEQTKIEYRNQQIDSLKLNYISYKDSFLLYKKKQAEGVALSEKLSKETSYWKGVYAQSKSAVNSSDTPVNNTLAYADSTIDSYSNEVEQYKYNLLSCNNSVDDLLKLQYNQSSQIDLYAANEKSYLSNISELEKRIKQPIFKGFAGVGANIGVRGMQGLYNQSDVKISVAGLFIDKTLIQVDYGFIRSQVGATVMYRFW